MDELGILRKIIPVLCQPDTSSLGVHGGLCCVIRKYMYDKVEVTNMSSSRARRESILSARLRLANRATKGLTRR